MLPTGHIAAGYLTGYAFLKYAKPDISPVEFQHLVYWAIFFGAAPDLDVFWFMIKNRTLKVASKDASGKSHRNSFLHVPFFWLVLGLAVYFLSPTVYLKTLGLLIWLSGWSHMILDSLAFGIPWLSPLSSKFYALLRPNQTLPIPEYRNFVRYVLTFLTFYSKEPTFYLEILVIFSALIVYFR